MEIPAGRRLLHGWVGIQVEGHVGSSLAAKMLKRMLSLIGSSRILLWGYPRTRYDTRWKLLGERALNRTNNIEINHVKNIPKQDPRKSSQTQPREVLDPILVTLLKPHLCRISDTKHNTHLHAPCNLLKAPRHL